MSTADADLILRRLDRSGPCWLWTGSISANGFGTVLTEAGQKYVHRVAYKAFVGELIPNVPVVQTCGNKSCARPDHLLMTRKGRVRDRIRTDITAADYRVDVLTECWVWLGSFDADGYGKVASDGRRWLAHRFSWHLRIGPIPEGLELDHLCHNTACINPSHLEPVSPTENKKRQWPAHKLSCVNGHPFDATNTSLDKRGRRRCRACWRASAARYKQRRARRT